MLPTTGHFKQFSCPFFDKCICERPYCHFKHQKREENEEQILSDLVSKAVHRVLAVNDDPSLQTDLISETSDLILDDIPGTIQEPVNPTGQVTYNPTPISELNKIKNSIIGSIGKEDRKSRRHIPIQYSPQRPHSNQTRQVGDSSNYIPKSITYVPSSIQSLKDGEETNRNKYKPEYIPTNPNETTKNISYLPTTISDDITNSTKSEYVPSSITTQKLQDDPIQLPNDDIEVFLDEFLNDPNIYEPDINPENNEYVPTEKPKTTESPRKPEKRTSDERHDDTSSKRHKPDSTKKHSSKTKSRSSSKTDVSKSHKKESSSRKDRSSSSSKTSKSTSKTPAKTSSKDKTDKKPDKNPSHKTAPEKSSSEKNLKSSSSKHRRHSDKNASKSTKESSKSSRKKSSRSDEQKSSKDKTSSHVSCLATDDNPENLMLSTEEIKMLNEDDLSDLDSDDPNSALEECKRIFDEYVPPKEEIKDVKPTIVPAPQEDNSVGKKRIAHENIGRVSRAPVVKKTIESPAQVLAKRYQIIKNTLPPDQLNNNPSSSKESAPSTFGKRTLARGSNESSIGSGPVKRIARVPNVMSLIDAKKKVQEMVKKQEDEKKRTPVQTVAKGAKRVPHVPDSALLDLPMVMEADRSKLPLNVRNRFLQLLVTECKKLYSSKEDIYERALNEEFTCYTKCSVINTYRNSTMLAINRLRKETENKANSSSNNGFSNVSANASYRPKKTIDNSHEFTGVNLYNNIKKWILTKKELEENGFPLPGASVRGTALFKDSKSYESLSNGMKRCSRCREIYSVDDHGFPVRNDECVYHPLGRFTFRGETKYICCKATVPADGCCTAETHVFDTGDPSSIRGFVTTLPHESSHTNNKNNAVYALDCEMLYTTNGLELARVTVVDIACKTVYESLVKPFGHIIDYNTRFSGLTKEIMSGVTKTLIDVQAALLHIFSCETILIGHSLESDFKALRLIHETVIDTSVLYPHKFGPPRKNALRSLASTYLNKIIQNSESGHDSAEDAITCVELILHKLKEELKTR